MWYRFIKLNLEDDTLVIYMNVIQVAQAQSESKKVTKKAHTNQNTAPLQLSKTSLEVLEATVWIN